MLLKRRIDYGFNGYRVPVVPRAPRSIRRRNLRKKPVGDGQLCAFELLATVAGKLLRESESSTSSNAAEGKYQYCVHKDDIRKEQVEDKTLRAKCHDRGSCMESVFIPGPAALVYNSKSSLKESPHVENDTLLERVSTVSNSCFSNEVGCDVKLENRNSKNVVENFPKNAEEGCSDVGESCIGNTENLTRRQLETAEEQNGDLTVGNLCSSKDPIELCANTQSLIISESSVEFPLYRDLIPNASFPMRRNDVKVDTRDDDENSFRCSKLSGKIQSVRPQSHVGYRRIRKMLTSKYWRIAPKLKDCEFSPTDGGMMSCWRNRRAICTRERCRYEAPSKRRKCFDHGFAAVYDQEATSESISNSTEKGMKGDKNGSAAIYHRATGLSSSVRGHQVSVQAKDSYVKLSIKSFSVPELYIEVPETATVGSLKRTVLEAVTAILGGGLRVGVLLQGKKVRDDGRTLLQTGISHSSNLDELGFTLEPGFDRVSPPKNTALMLPCDTDQQLSRSPVCSILEPGFSKTSFDQAPVTNLDNHTESNCDLVTSQDNLLTDGTVSDSKSLVSVSAINTKALTVVPMNQKPRHSEFLQRRTRRPFSVSEVEALVEAVEQLGTGRWRDVKVCAFDNADHRTYVDLKDKWKTLVHTASISPQQRRGEPVPQELLDRVLAAHAYWSQHQSKHQAEPLRISGDEMPGVGG